MQRKSEQHHEFDTEVLVIGTGPAGGSCALSLAKLGIDVTVVNKYRWTAPTPRAHITNQRTVEILRDLGVADDALALAVPNTMMGENVYCTSLTGDELGRLRTWGTQPERAADYAMASPERICDLPQNLLEPILVSYAAKHRAKVRFNTEFLRFEQDQTGVTSFLFDREREQEFTIRSRYLVGADGANSRVLDCAKLPLEGRMGVSGSMNIVFEADLAPYVSHRPGVLYWVIQPGSDVGGLGIGVVRMVRPWHRWLAIWGYDVEAGPPEITDEFATGIVRNLVGVPDLEVSIEETSTWTVNDVYATRLSDGRVFCIGDAVHRHPPTNGLGSNHSIQDGYNLAWKLAYVLKGLAGPALLESFNEERAPIARQTVERANKSLELFPPILSALGLLDTNDPEQMKRNMDELKATTPSAAARRKSLREAIDASDYVYNCHGVEMNQRYQSSAVAGDDVPMPDFSRDAELFYEPTSTPGARLPHGWVTRNGHLVSTLHLCGEGRFTILTGLTGERWVETARSVSNSLGIPIDVHVIGPGREIEDPHGDFERLRETEEGGALLIRPDVYVGWRARKGTDADHAGLDAIMRTILGFDKEASVTAAAE